jgi:hypothetical protein
MSKVLVHSALALGLLVFTTASRQLVSSKSSTMPQLPDNYYEECIHEGCSQEEKNELFEDYREECLAESCSTSELSDIAGGAAYIDPMLVNFLTNSNWIVSTTNFQSQEAPPAKAVWWYTGCNYTGTVVQTTGNQASMPELLGINFNTSILGFKIGSGINNVTIWTTGDYKGTSLVTPASIACLSNTAPTFANNVQSAQVSP